MDLRNTQEAERQDRGGTQCEGRLFGPDSTFFFLQMNLFECNCGPFWVLSILELARSESRIFPLVWLKSAAMRP